MCLERYGKMKNKAEEILPLYRLTCVGCRRPGFCELKSPCLYVCAV